jgi:hypothetical protein
MKLTTRLHLMLRSGLRGAMPPRHSRLHGVVFNYDHGEIYVFSTCINIAHGYFSKILTYINSFCLYGNISRLDNKIREVTGIRG